MLRPPGKYGMPKAWQLIGAGDEEQRVKGYLWEGLEELDAKQG